MGEEGASKGVAFAELFWDGERATKTQAISEGIEEQEKRYEKKCHDESKETGERSRFRTETALH